GTGVDGLAGRQAFGRIANIDLLAALRGDGSERATLAASAAAAGIRVADDDTWADVFTRILLERIEPALGDGRATILYEYPARLSALARPKAGDPRFAERFELYACGV